MVASAGLTRGPENERAMPSPAELWRLEGRAVIVTGASRGIGRAVAELAYAAGASVLLVGTDEAALREVVDQFGESERLTWIALDLTEPDAATRIARRCAERFGSIDAVVNNAGVNASMSLAAPDHEALNAMLAVNLRAPIALVEQTLAHGLGQRPGAAVVNIASTGGLRTFPTPGNPYGAYSVTKAALVHLTRNLALELAPRVRVNAIAPGITSTDRVVAMLGEDRPDFAGHLPLGRPGRPAEVAAAVLFLLGEASSYITGEVLVVDGGGMLV